jgi:hypothetical protein
MASRIGDTVIATAPRAYATECRFSVVATTAKPNPTILADWIVESWQASGNNCF